MFRSVQDHNEWEAACFGANHSSIFFPEMVQNSELEK
jgi:hypothetical protein